MSGKGLPQFTDYASGVEGFIQRTRYEVPNLDLKIGPIRLSNPGQNQAPTTKKSAEPSQKKSTSQKEFHLPANPEMEEWPFFRMPIFPAKTPDPDSGLAVALKGFLDQHPLDSIPFQTAVFAVRLFLWLKKNTRPGLGTHFRRASD